MEIAKNLYYYEAEILKVVDGDTVDVMIDFGLEFFGKKRLRILRIDCPEVRGKGKESGLVAKKFLIDLFAQHQNQCIIHTVEFDGFGRALAEIWVGEDVNVSELLLKEGLATYY